MPVSFMMQRTARYLPGSDEPDSQLSITASALLYFFLRHTGVVSRDEVLKKSGMIMA